MTVKPYVNVNFKKLKNTKIVMVTHFKTKLLRQMTIMVDNMDKTNFSFFLTVIFFMNKVNLYNLL